MTAKFPSIFNDVIGPVMRGPSSSHCAASVRIGRLARDLMGGNLTDVHITFDANGSLATTHESQGTDMGLFSGFLGRNAEDEELVHYKESVKESGLNIQIKIEALNDPHPNTYHLQCFNYDENLYMKAISLGGGMMEITQIGDIPLSIGGDYYETLIFLTKGDDINLITHFLNTNGVTDTVILNHHPISEQTTAPAILQVQGARFLDPHLLKQIGEEFNIPEQKIKRLEPVLPILSGSNMTVPFLTASEMEIFNRNKNLEPWQLAVHYESQRGNLDEGDVIARMVQIVKLMRRSIEDGISGKGADYQDRILGHQSGRFQEKMKSGALLDGGLLNKIVLYTTAMMETKSSMGVIVAAPTAGSCGALPGAILAAGDVLGCDDENVAKAMLSAGLIGIFIVHRSTFAAEVCGCQAECGAASGMAAAGLISLMGGDCQQMLTASSMALQNIFGMTCDPVANRVEVPCLGKNIMAASNALTCANMALAGFDAVIPLDEVIEAMDKVGKSLPHELRCTALGGLSTTATSLKISRQLSP
jgi:L-serine dehydratase